MEQQSEKQSLKILRITASMDPKHGGPVQMIRSTSALHREMGHHTDVVSLDPPDSDYFKDQAFHPIPLGPGKYGWAYNSKLKPWLKEHLEEYDAVIIHGLWLYPSVAAADVLRQKQKRKHPVPTCFIFPHGMLDPWFQSWRRRPIKTLRNTLYWHLLEKRTIRAADAVLYTSQTEMRLGRQTFWGYQSANDIVVPYGCMSPPPETEAMQVAFREKCSEVVGNAYWLYLSRIHPKKGVDLLLKGYLDLLNNPSLNKVTIPHLVIAGPGMETGYGHQIAEIASQKLERIHFPGMLQGDAKWGAFYGSSGFFLLSHQENFGISVVEALGCGKRVYISDQVNIHEEISKEQAGVVEKDNEQGVANLLGLAVKDWEQSRAEQFSKVAHDCFKKHFDIANTARCLIALVDDNRVRKS